jgi:phytoene synthase
MLPEVSAFINLSSRIDLNPKIPRLLADAIIQDTQPVRTVSWDELVRYAYGVAASVGLMMCSVMCLREQAAHPFAIDLGIAMQLTNIARKVVEDAGRDRRYLPADWLGKDIHPSELLSGEAGVRRRVAEAHGRLLNHAATYYRSADQGMRFIPFRARLAVLAAARLYEAIEDRIQSPSLKWGDRAYVDSPRKMRIILGALASVLLNPAYNPSGRQPAHDSGLHRPIFGLPGAHGEA